LIVVVLNILKIDAFDVTAKT